MGETNHRSSHDIAAVFRTRTSLVTAALALLSVTGCASEETARVPEEREPAALSLDPVAAAATPKPSLCERPAHDAVRDIFCADAPPPIRGLRDLEDHLGLNSRLRDAEPAEVAPPTPDSLSDVGVFLTHSTALSGRLVSPINPRAIIFGPESILTFQRGVQQVEVVAQDRMRGVLNFYLISFRQACNATEHGCTPGDLYTPRVEERWTSVALRDDEDLKNTALDCRQCHQRGREDAALLMRELQSPWTHFFEPDYLDSDVGATLPGVRGRDLLHDYLRAKGDEPYAQVSSGSLRHTAGLFLQNLVFPNQPVFFDAPLIEEERWPFGPSGFPDAPSASATWDAAYEAFKRGEQLALPYFEPRVTDPDKQARLTDAYARLRRGELPVDELPDLADIFPDDPSVRAKIGLQTEPEAAPAALLIQACGSCHNDVLDQTISRARFNVDLARMSRAEIDIAIARIALPSMHPAAMPPREFRQLDASGRARLTAWLRAGAYSEDDIARLQHAARVGMTSGGRF